MTLATTVPETHTFRAVWPVLHPATPVADLTRQALADLPAVALRHGVRLVTTVAPVVEVMPGRLVPGSGGAHTVVVATALVVRCRDLPESDDA